jgi:hypothetical protein
MWSVALTTGIATIAIAVHGQSAIRKYLNLRQRYRDPLKNARLRQHLHETTEKAFRFTVQITVPILFNANLILFFIGFVDFTLAIGKKTGVASIVAIVICGVLCRKYTL